MNKHLIKANDHWCKNNTKAAICFYKKALHSTLLQQHESNIAYYMLAYLNCTLAREMSQAEASMGVDLRRPYQDFYLEAARYLHQIDDASFSVDVLALPSLDATVQAKIEQAWRYLQQLQQVYITSWKVRLKSLLQAHLQDAWRKMQQQIHA